MQTTPWCHRGISSSSVWLQITQSLSWLWGLGLWVCVFTCYMTLATQPRQASFSSPEKRGSNPFPKGYLKTQWANEFRVFPLAGESKVSGSVHCFDVSYLAALRVRTSLMPGRAAKEAFQFTKSRKWAFCTAMYDSWDEGAGWWWLRHHQNAKIT